MPFCGECGAEVPAGINFCGKCGKPLTSGQSQGTYQQVKNADIKPPPIVDDFDFDDIEKRKRVDRIGIGLGLGGCFAMPFAALFVVLVVVFLILKFTCEMFSDNSSVTNSEQQQNVAALTRQNNTETAQSGANVFTKECSFDEIKTPPLITFSNEDENEDYTSSIFGLNGNEILLFIDSQTKDSIIVVKVFGETYREMYKFIFNKTLKDAEETLCRYDISYEEPYRHEKISHVEKKTLKTSKDAEAKLKKAFSEARAAMYKELGKFSTNGNNDVTAYVRNGMKYLESGDNNRRPADYDLAVTEFDKTIRLSPNNAEAYYGRGRAYLRKGDNNRAVTDYSQAIRLNPNDAISYSNRGRAYARMGDYDNAVADFESALRIDPNNETIKQNLEKARRREKGL